MASVINKTQLQRLYRYCFSLTAAPGDAEDLLHTAIEKWIKSGRQKASHSQDDRAYIRRIIRNTFIDQCRRQKIISFETLAPDSPPLLDETNLEELLIQRNLIERIFEKLNNAEREVLYLWSVEGFTAAEIAEETDQARGTVLSRLYRIRKKAATLGDEATLVNLKRIQ